MAQTQSKFRIPEAKIRTLTVAMRPSVDATGKTVFVPNTDGKPYRFKDGNAGAPTGFGVYVGKDGARYEVVKRVGKQVMRVALGSVHTVSLTNAHEEARTHLAYMQKGMTPREVKKKEQDVEGARRITVRMCMERYIAKLNVLIQNDKRKANSVDSVQDSLARLARPEVDIADKEVAQLTDEMLVTAWYALRKSSMQKSNRITAQEKQALVVHKEWWKLDTAHYHAMGIKGKNIQRARAAGLVAVEHTFADMSRAIVLAIKKEQETAKRVGRPVELAFNPIDPIFEMGLWRTGDEMKKHYRRAEVRNPLSKDDTLPAVLKTLVARRSSMNGLNAVAVDYMLLTLLWGARRNEGARLMWYDRVDKDTLLSEKVSWVWLASSPDDVNPTTKKKGSQVFFHDTKNNEARFLPLAYFAERILRRRLDDHLTIKRELPRELISAEKALREIKKTTDDYRKIGAAENNVEIAKQKMKRMVWVFPARNKKSKEGHYKDSKSILANVREDAGLVDIRKDIDIGLTMHDLKRTLGRFASEHVSGRMVSALLNHTQVGEDKMAKVSERYSEQEWGSMRDALAVVEEAMIATSPRAWNALKGPDKPRLDDTNDPPAVVKSGLRKTEEEE